MNRHVRVETGIKSLARPNLFRESAYVGGVWTNAPETLPVYDPASGEKIGTIPSLSKRVVEHAVGAAHQAFAEWRARTARERSQLLRRWHALIEANAQDLARLITTEQGKPLAEAAAEVQSTAAYVEWFAEEARRAYGDTIPAHRPDKRILVNKAPVGVVAAITPWNFPSSMIARKVAPALAAGCTVVLKPSELTPFSAIALAVLAEEAGLPPGVFSVVTGEPRTIGDVLIEDARVRKFTFTGSTVVGKQLAARAMNTVKRVSLELGGNAPFIVFEDADVDAAVEGAMLSKFRNSGQTCICANRFLIHDAVYDAFAQKLAERAKALAIGNGADPLTQQGPLICKSAIKKVARHVDDALSKGARLLTGGKPHDNGRHFEPTVLADVSPASLLCHEETFGPLAALIRFNDEQRAVALANDNAAGLAAYLFTRNLARAHRVSDALEYGMVGINTGLLTTEVAPFGGVKESGLGREGSHYGLDDYLDVRMVCIDVPAL